MVFLHEPNSLFARLDQMAAVGFHVLQVNMLAGGHQIETAHGHLRRRFADRRRLTTGRSCFAGMPEVTPAFSMRPSASNTFLKVSERTETTSTAVLSYVALQVESGLFRFDTIRFGQSEKSVVLALRDRSHPAMKQGD